MKNLLLAIFLTVISINRAYANNWVFVGKDSYIDTTSIQALQSEENNQRRFSYSFLFTRPDKKIYGKNVDFGITKVIANCEQQKIIIKEISLYDKNGYTVNNYKLPDSWISFDTHSIFDNICTMLCISPDNSKLTNISDTSATYNKSLTPTQIYENAINSAVYITTKDKQGEITASGSGTIIQKDGSIVTAFHVVAIADDIEVELNDGSIYKVNGFKYINPIDDIAIITVDSSRQFTPLKIANSNNIHVGEKIYALANPRGLQFTFVDGMINQKREQYIQYSAPSSPGSSGGTLLNDNGELIGVITSQYHDAQNINFAIPSNNFSTQIANKTLKNTKKLPWTDFIISEANSEQLKIYTAFGLALERIEISYKALKMFTSRKDFPKNRYVMLGNLAMFTALQTSSREDFDKYIKESIQWFEKSKATNIAKETCTYALSILPAFYLETPYYENLLKKNITELEKYDSSYKKLTYLTNNNCEDDDDECLMNRATKSLIYISVLTDKEMGEKYMDLSWLKKLYFPD